MGKVRDFFSKLNDFAITGGSTLIETEKILPVERSEINNGSIIGKEAIPKDKNTFSVPKNKFMTVVRKILPKKFSHNQPVAKQLTRN